LKYDLIVCGAGPAGAMAAETAARGGMRVLLLEKERLPRYKTCGGGMPMVVGEFLRGLAPEAFIEADVSWMRHTWGFQKPVLAALNPPDAEPPITVWMVQRSRFDHALVERAVAAGANLQEGTSVRALEVDRHGVTVRTAVPDSDREQTFTADRVIGADGANGITARAAGLRRKRKVAVAVEIEHPHQWGVGHPELRPDVMHLEYGALKRGYAWVFPKGDHLSVGAGVFQPERLPNSTESIGAQLKEVVFRYLESLAIPYSRTEVRFHAHPIPLWGGREPLHTRNGRILLVGDAAGLVNPMFGDGIYHAVRSGIVASECLLNGTPLGYTRRVHAEVAGPFPSLGRLATLAYDWSSMVYERGISRPRATHLAAKLLCGQPISPDLMAMLLSRLRAALRESGRQGIINQPPTS
jgi:geranylgeranyl reductase family protein